MTHAKFMIYGANGYTGRLIAEEAKRRGLNPVLAGRSSDVRALAKDLGFEARIFSLRSAEQIAPHLKGVAAVLHCAGPFSATSQPMLDGCLFAKVHYFDITGEIDVFEQIHARHSELKAAGIAALPGVGFDVVPTDCIAAMLKERLPDATTLTLAFKAPGGASAGTTKSSIEGLSKGGRIRRDGKIIAATLCSQSKMIFYKGIDSRPTFSILVPWGDVSTAFHSTGIPNIEIYMAASKSVPLLSKAIAWLAKKPTAQKTLKSLASAFIKGPSTQTLTRSHALIWGEARNAKGQVATLRLQTPNGYALTADSSLTAIERALSQGTEPGFHTPSQAFGPKLVLELSGVCIIES